MEKTWKVFSTSFLSKTESSKISFDETVLPRDGQLECSSFFPLGIEWFVGCVNDFDFTLSRVMPFQAKKIMIAPKILCVCFCCKQPVTLELLSKFEYNVAKSLGAWSTPGRWRTATNALVKFLVETDLQDALWTCPLSVCVSVWFCVHACGNSLYFNFL